MPGEVVLAALGHVWLTLQPLSVPMAVMGGLALATWKVVRATRDVDILVGIGAGEVAPILSRLSAVGVRPKRSPPVNELGELKVVQLQYEVPEAFVEVQVDLLLGASEYHRAALARRTPVQLPDLDFSIAVLACEDLILHKLLAGRVIDRVDVAGLLRANRGALDFGYLGRWADRLQCLGALREVGREAWPGEPLPAEISG